MHSQKDQAFLILHRDCNKTCNNLVTNLWSLQMNRLPEEGHSFRNSLHPDYHVPKDLLVHAVHTSLTLHLPSKIISA